MAQACLLHGLLCYSFIVFTVAASQQAAKKPHILFIVADDLGWNDLGFRSSQIRTPNLDKLVSEGVILDQYYVQCVCSPSRATFMTGRYPLHNTINYVLDDGQAQGLPLNETLMPEMLAQAGYRSHAVGKWHLGFHTWNHTPTFRGFESFFGYYSAREDYYTHSIRDRYDLRRDTAPRCGRGCSQIAWQENGTYSTHLFAKEASRLIEEHDTSNPLFLYLAFQAVHIPAQVPDSYVDAYRYTIADPVRRTFAGMLACLDEAVGNVTSALREKGILDDTLIVFSTDNGGSINYGQGIGSENYPLRGGKHSIWEGGTRGTAFIWAGNRTGLVSNERKGSTIDNLMHGVDWLPTFCNVAGLNASQCRPFSGVSLDGIDQSGPLFQNATTVRHEVLYGRHDSLTDVFPGYDTALRDSEGWKFIQGWGGKPHFWSQPVNGSLLSALETSSVNYQDLLFNVLTDPGEHHDVSAQHPDIVARLQQRLAALRAEGVDVVGGGGHTDPSCPSYDSQPHVEEHVGPIWEPWCETSKAETSTELQI